MLAKVEKDNKILMQLINHHKKLAEAAKNKVSTDVQMLTLFITNLIFTNSIIKIHDQVQQLVD
jgi:hypothetical protein